MKEKSWRKSRSSSGAVLEGIFGVAVFLLYLPELGELVLFQTEHFLINVLDAEISALLEIFVRQRFQEGLNIGDGEKIFEIIDEGQDQHVLPGIFFLRGKAEADHFSHNC